MKIFCALGLSLVSVAGYAQDAEPTSEPAPLTQASPMKDPVKEVKVEEPAEEEEGGFSYGIESDFNTIYGWRGIALSSGPVEQPSVWASVAGATLFVWSSFATNGEDGFGTFQETDIIGEYELEVAGFTLIPRVTAYLVPEEPVVEVELEADHDIVGPLGLYVINSVGVAGSPGSYFGQAGLSVAQDLDMGLSLEAKAGLGVGNGIFNEFNIGVDKVGLDVLSMGAAASYYFAHDHLYARLHSELQEVLDGDLAGSLGKSFILNGGLAFGFEM